MANQKGIYEIYISNAKENYLSSLVDRTQFTLFGKKITVDSSLNAAKNMSVKASVTAVSNCLFSKDTSVYSKELYKYISKVADAINEEVLDYSEDLEIFAQNLITKHSDGVENVIAALLMSFKENSETVEAFKIAADIIKPETYNFNKLSEIKRKLPLFMYFNEFIKFQRESNMLAIAESNAAEEKSLSLFRGRTIGGMICAHLANEFLNELITSFKEETPIPEDDLAELLQDEQALKFIKEFIVLDLMYIYYYMIDSIANKGKELYGLENNPTLALDGFFDSFEKAYKLCVIAIAKHLNVEFIPDFRGVTKAEKELTDLKLMEKVILKFPYSRYFYDKYFEMGGKPTPNLKLFADIHMVDLSDIYNESSDFYLNKESVDSLLTLEALNKKLEKIQKARSKREKQEQERQVNAEKISEVKKLIKKEQNILEEENQKKAAEQKLKDEQENQYAKNISLKRELEEKRLEKERETKIKEEQAVGIAECLSAFFDEDLIKEHLDLFCDFTQNKLYVSNQNLCFDNHLELAQIIFNHLETDCRGFQTNIHTPSSPKFQKLAANLMTIYGAAAVNPSNIIIVYDDTIGGSAKDGFVITREYFCFRNLWKAPVIIPLKEIKYLAFKSNEIHINNHIVDIHYCGLPTKQIFEITNYLICYLLQMNKTNPPISQPQYPPQAANSFNFNYASPNAAIQTEEWFCIKCGTKNIPQSKFCMECGAQKIIPQTDWFCTKCGTKNIPQSKFCMECGNPK